MKPYAGYYFTGDGASCDSDGYYWVRGRIDDVINVSGHRLSTAEIESALVMYEHCAEAAVVAIPDDITGQSIFCYVCLKQSGTGIASDVIVKAFTQQVRTHIGPFATPRRLVVVEDLPKTRSGKIMRRLLRKIACGEHSHEQLGDLSTLADPQVIPALIAKVQGS